MRERSRLQTVRFSEAEQKVVADYLKQNPIFDSFSSLARVATLSFVGQAGTIHLNPLSIEKKQKRPVFLWDYNLNDVQLREILRSPGLSAQKKWLIGRILTEARFEEVWEYLSVSDIRRALPSLRVPEKVRRRWEYAISRWTRNG